MNEPYVDLDRCSQGGAEAAQWRRIVASFPGETVRDGVSVEDLTVHTVEDWTFATEAATGTLPYTPRTLEWTIEAYR